jgi:N-methylhydantoinase B/oxoprolinase/acetone carboxylase alpha subunit
MGARRLIVAAIVGLGLLAFAGGAQACSCAPMAAGRALRQADAAFVGRLLKVVPRGRSQADYRYSVQRVYKAGGRLHRGGFVVVRSARAGSACGQPSAIGRRYGVLLVARHVSPAIGGKGDARGGRRWRGSLCGVLAPEVLGSVAVGRSVGATTSSCAS